MVGNPFFSPSVLLLFGMFLYSGHTSSVYGGETSCPEFFDGPIEDTTIKPTGVEGQEYFWSKTIPNCLVIVGRPNICSQGPYIEYGLPNQNDDPVIELSAVATVPVCLGRGEVENKERTKLKSLGYGISTLLPGQTVVDLIVTPRFLSKEIVGQSRNVIIERSSSDIHQLTTFTINFSELGARAVVISLASNAKADIIAVRLLFAVHSKKYSAGSSFNFGSCGSLHTVYDVRNNQVGCHLLKERIESYLKKRLKKQ